MGDKDTKTLLQEASDLTSTEPGSALGKWKTFVRVIAIGIPVLGAIPTAYQLSLAFFQDSSYVNAWKVKEQAGLWKKNFACEMKYQALETGQGTRVNIGACPQSGDIYVKVSTNDGTLANQEWIPYENISGNKTGFSIFGSLISAAHAKELVDGSRSQSKPLQRVAEAGMTVVCQKLGKKGKVLRIVKEDDKCFKENFSIFKGSIDGREEVPCETTCNGETKS